MITIEPGTPDTSKPTVLIENLWATGALTVSTEGVDAEGANAASEGTFDFWTPTAMPATFEVDLGVSDNADCLGIAAHNLGSKGATVALERWTGSAWTAVSTITPDDDTTILILFPDASATRWRLNISGPQPVSIGFTMLGRRIVLPGIVGDYTPTDWGERIEILGGKSVSGQFLQQRTLSYGAEATVNLGRIRRDWHKTTGRAFQHHFNSGRSFFFAGWPNTLETDVALCQRSEGRAEMRTAIVDAVWAVLAFDVDCYVPSGLTYEVEEVSAEGDGSSSGSSGAGGSGSSTSEGSGSSSGSGSATGTGSDITAPAAFADGDWSVAAI